MSISRRGAWPPLSSSELKDVLATLPQLHLDHAFDQLTRLLKPNSSVHRGIYRGDKPGLVIYSAVGGIGRPVAKLNQLKASGWSQRSESLSGV